MSTDNDFKRGSKGSSAVMMSELTKEQLHQFMESSFYLPVDVLKNKDWLVLPIKVMTGNEFTKLLGTHADYRVVYTVESIELLKQAQYVAVSIRRHKSGINCTVAKIWYGAAPTQRHAE